MSALKVVRAGLFDTIQDLGRIGYMALGMPTAGAMDRVGLTLANALVSRTWDGQIPNDHINLGPYALTADGHQLLTYCIATNVFPTPNLSSSQAVLYSTPVDAVAPTVTGSPDRPANQAGWYRAPVTVTWSATDPPPSSGAPRGPSRPS